MQEGDGETNYAYYALHKLNIMPWDFAALDPRKKSALIAMIDERVDNENRERNKNRRR